jgi:hypothetical protein
MRITDCGGPVAVAGLFAIAIFFADASVAIAEGKPMSLTITSTAFAPEGAIL